MTHDNIIRMALMAGIDYSFGAEIERFAALVAAAEREACALLCEAEAEKWEGDGGPICAEARMCAVAIRARGTGKHSLPVAEEQEIGARGDA